MLLMLAGAILVQPSTMGWAVAGIGFVIAATGFASRVWMAGLRGTAIETGEWTRATRHRTLIVLALAARILGPVVVVAGLFQ